MTYFTQKRNASAWHWHAMAWLIVSFHNHVSEESGVLCTSLSVSFIDNSEVGELHLVLLKTPKSLSHQGWLHSQNIPMWRAEYKKPWFRLSSGLHSSLVFCAHISGSWAERGGHPPQPLDRKASGTWALLTPCCEVTLGWDVCPGFNAVVLFHHFPEWAVD